MAESEDIDMIRVDEIFEQNKSIIYKCMANNVEKKKIVLELKSKIYAAEEQKSKLMEYIKLLETIIRKGSKYGELISNLNSTIEEGKNSIIDIRKDIAVLESEKKIKPKPAESKTNLVRSMKKTLSEMNNKYVDSFIEKEKRLLELQKQIKELDSPDALKDKQELDDYIKEYEFLKAKNLRLKEMITLNMEQKI